ncbi:MAG: beta-lactamase family protein [Cyclobacteriaceae bacterium]|nr:beta-lactamase family protein [Cyclobacteriaceae bacterium]
MSVLSVRGTGALNDFFREHILEGDLPGAVAMVTGRDEILYQGSFGHCDVANKRQMKPSSLFNIASMTKPVTSTVIMMLVDRGLLNLNDPVSKYLKSLKSPDVLLSLPVAGPVKVAKAHREVTIRDLLTHTAGFAYGFSNKVYRNLIFKAGFNYMHLPLLHEPGMRWTYGFSTGILGNILRKVTGKPLTILFKEYVFDPLGMEDTFYYIPQDKYRRLVTLHRKVHGVFCEEPRPVYKDQPLNIAGDGGLYSTAGDYCRFMQLFLNDGTVHGNRLLSSETVNIMKQNQIGAVNVEIQYSSNKLISEDFPLGAGKDKFGLGFQIAMEKRPFRRSVGSLSWAGLYNTHFWIDFQKGIGGVLMLQVLPFYDSACINLLTGFEELVYSNLMIMHK